MFRPEDLVELAESMAMDARAEGVVIRPGQEEDVENVYPLMNQTTTLFTKDLANSMAHSVASAPLE